MWQHARRSAARWGTGAKLSDGGGHRRGSRRLCRKPGAVRGRESCGSRGPVVDARSEMRGFRLGRLSIAVTLLCTLLIPAVGSLADPGDDLQRTQNELERVRDQLEADQATAGNLRD